MQKALLAGLLEPTARLQRLESDGDYTSRLAIQEEIKSLPFGAVWDHFCATSNVPVGETWLGEVKAYERSVVSARS
jgi:L-rhamnose isomerase